MQGGNISSSDCCTPIEFVCFGWCTNLDDSDFITLLVGIPCETRNFVGNAMCHVSLKKKNVLRDVLLCRRLHTDLNVHILSNKTAYEEFYFQMYDGWSWLLPKEFIIEVFIVYAFHNFT